MITIFCRIITIIIFTTIVEHYTRQIQKACLMVNVSPLFVSQGSTLRKRKMYEEFLSKVSILGKSVNMHKIVSPNEHFSLCFTVNFCFYNSSVVYAAFRVHFKHQVRESRVQAVKSAEFNIYCRLAHINTGAGCHTGTTAE